MRQVDTVRKRLADRGAWFRVGLASATIATPLISRWNDLRANERVRDFADEAEERIRDYGAWAPWSRGKRLEREAVAMVREVSKRATGQRSRAASAIWLVGVGLGLVAAGTGAYLLVRRRLDAEADESLIAVIASPDTANGHSHTHDVESRSSDGSAPASDQSAAMGEDEASDATPTAPSAAAEDEPPAEEAGIATETLQEALFIGNIRTMVYHEADAEGLPAEENRIYFATEEEARAAGFRRDRDEILPPTESEASTNAGS